MLSRSGFLFATAVAVFCGGGASAAESSQPFAYYPVGSVVATASASGSPYVAPDSVVASADSDPFGYHSLGSVVAEAASVPAFYAPVGGIVAEASSSAAAFNPAGSVLAEASSPVACYLPVGAVVASASSSAASYLPVGAVVASASSEPFVFGTDDWSSLSDAVAGVGTFERRPEGGWLVSLTNDVDGALVLPDRLGAVVLDLCGHDLVGPDGLDSLPGEPGGKGGAAVEIVVAPFDGAVTQLQIVDSVPDDEYDVIGGNGGAGDPGGNGGVAVWVDECSTDAGVTVSVGPSVGLSGGMGGEGLSEGATSGLAAIAVRGALGRNEGKIALVDIGYDPLSAETVSVWDGAGHGIDVVVDTPKEGYEILYSVSPDGPFGMAQPLYTNVCERAEIWYEIRAWGYATVTNVGHVTILAYGAGHAGSGSVIAPKTVKVGRAATWKAVAGQGSVFVGWSGPCVEALSLNERRNPTLSIVVSEGMEAPVATFALLDLDGLTEVGFRFESALFKGVPVTGAKLVDDSASYLTAQVSGLPSGLRFDSKTLSLTGTPTKAGDYSVKITASNAGGYKLTVTQALHVSDQGGSAQPAGEPVVVSSVSSPLCVMADASGGTVSGTGVYGADVVASVSAKPAKSMVFAGWYQDPAFAEPVNFASGDYRQPNQRISPGAVSGYLFARFVRAGSDEDAIALSCKESVSCRPKEPFDGASLALECRSASLPSYSAKGLPSGLKIDKSTGEISGSPKKPGRYAVTVSAVNQSKQSATVQTEIVVVNFHSPEVDIADAYGPLVPGVAVEIALPEAKGCSASGLPSGLRWTSSSGLVSGAPTKPGEYVVTFKKTVRIDGRSTACQSSATFVVGPFPQLTVVVVGLGNEGGGSVKGGGGYAAGKSVSLRATPDAGAYFAGWFADDGVTPLSGDYLALTHSVTMPGRDMTLVAKFGTLAELEAAGLIDFAPLASDPDAEWWLDAGVAVTQRVDLSGTILTSVTVSGLPKGLKYDSKSGCIVGVPTDTKLATYHVKVVGKGTGGLSKTAVYEHVYVRPLPAAFVGTFNGAVSMPDGRLAPLEMTISSSGRISGKCKLDGKSQLFTLPSFSAGYTACLTLSLDGEPVSFRLSLETRPYQAEVGGCMEALDQGVVKGSVVGAELAAPDEVPTLVVYRNVWSEPACKSVFAKTTSGLSPLVGTYSDVLCYGETEDFEPGDFLDMKLQQSGAVTLTGKIHGCTVSGSSVLIGETFTCLGWTLVGKRQVVAAGRWEALLVVDFPPKASKGFVGYSRCLSLVFEYDGSVRLTVR